MNVILAPILLYSIKMFFKVNRSSYIANIQYTYKIDGFLI